MSFTNPKHLTFMNKNEKKIRESWIQEKKNMIGWSKNKVWVPKLHESGAHYLSKTIYSSLLSVYKSSFKAPPFSSNTAKRVKTNQNKKIYYCCSLFQAAILFFFFFFFFLNCFLFNNFLKRKKIEHKKKKNIFLFSPLTTQNSFFFFFLSSFHTVFSSIILQKGRNLSTEQKAFFPPHVEA